MTNQLIIVNLTSEEVRLLEIIREGISKGHADIEIKIQDGKAVSAFIKTKIKL